MKLTYQDVWGFVAGLALVAATVSTTLIMVPMLLVIGFARHRQSSKNLRAFTLWIVMTVVVLVKTLYIDEMGPYVLRDAFFITILGLFAVIEVSPRFLVGLSIGFLPIALLDMTSNVLQFFTGSGLFGTEANTLRADGSRLTGLFDNSFYSLSLTFAAILGLNASTRFPKTQFILWCIMPAVGSFRGVLLPLIFITRSLVLKFSWPITYCFAIFIALAVGLLNVAAVQFGFSSEESGNANRVYAWSHAFEVIAESPFFGLNVRPPELPPSISMNKENIVEYQIYESTLLQDCVRYGAIYVFAKLGFFYIIGQRIFERASASSHLDELKKFIIFFAVVDYVIFSFFGMPSLALVGAAILATSGRSDDKLLIK